MSAFSPELRTTLQRWREDHPGWGAKTLRAELERAPQFQHQRLPSCRSIARWLQAEGLSHPRQPHQALPAPLRPPLLAPHEEREMDARVEERVPGVGLVMLIDLNDRLSHVRLLSYPCWVGDQRVTRAAYLNAHFQSGLANPLVAQHIAQQLGLDVAGVVTGAEITTLSSEALLAAVNQASLFAEVDPNQKEQIIGALRKTGHVVGYMGDGINDAPALYTADVGISVDTAVDVAKDAADFVLLKKDLAVLHRGIIGGRTTFANTLKYVFMTVSANFGNMFSVAGASPFLPMLPKQILLINFLTDLPEMTIAGDNVDPEQIAQPERWNIGAIRDFIVVGRYTLDHDRSAARSTTQIRLAQSVGDRPGRPSPRGGRVWSATRTAARPRASAAAVRPV